MADSRKKIITALIFSAVIFAVSVCYTIVFDSTHSPEELYKDLCDCFFAAGITLVCWGLLTLAAKDGTFNFFSYNAALLSSFVIPRLRETRQVSYYDYTRQKEEDRKQIRTSHIFVIGGLYCAVGVVFLILFYAL